MGAYKQFLASDIIVAPHEVHKEFSLKSKAYSYTVQVTSPPLDVDVYAAYFSDSYASVYPGVGINRLLGTNITNFMFNSNVDPITGDYYKITSPDGFGSVASLNFSATSFNSQATSIGSSSFLINNTMFVVTGSSLPLNSYNTIYISSGSTGDALANSIQNYINASSSTYPGIYNILASNVTSTVTLSSKTRGYINNYNYFTSGSDTIYFTGGTNDIVSGSYQYQRLVYNSIKELYYSNYQTSTYGDSINRPILIPGRDVEGDRYVGSSNNQAYDNYLQSTLTYPRFFPTGSNNIIGVISIPNTLFGDYIQPNSFLLQTESGSFTDDGEGNIISGSQIVGNIIYPHGLIILTGNEKIYASGSNSPLVGSVYGSAVYSTNMYGSNVPANATFNSWFNGLLNAISSTNVTCSFSSSYTIYETQYKCTIRESEFNSTLNPSIMLGSYNTGSKSGMLNDNVTGSYFDPYITTVGLYDEQQNLLAIGKLAQPLPSSPTTDTTIIINLDR